jgi:N-acetylglucosaminyldiphosphoundecaprenol N-acetyl-beta-D-mannosaminyltransferase
LEKSSEKLEAIHFRNRIARNMNSSDILTRDLIGTPVCALSFDEQINLIITWAKNHQHRIVCVANVHMLIEASQNSQFTEVLRCADLVTPDGMPLVWMLKLIGEKQCQRVAGMDIFLATCEQASKAQISIFLLGSKLEILDQICQRLKQEFPLLKIAGAESPPFQPLSSAADMNIVQIINTSGAQVVFVALGCPKQELWMAQHRDKIQAVMIGVGGVFPVYAGVLKQTPQLIQRSGLEWLFRLSQEPGRLWKRYAMTIPIFVWLALKQILVSKL